MRVSSIFILLIFAFLFLVDRPLLMSVANAADITAPGLHVKAFEANPKKIDEHWPSDPVSCDLVLDGEIKEGDAATLERKFAALVEDARKRIESWWTITYFLCQRSTGGDLREAVKIAQIVLDAPQPIAAVVEDGQTCASACALIFLAGKAPDVGGRVARPHRFLHPRGRLLYHSTQVDLSKFSNEELLTHLMGPTTDPRGLKDKITDLYRDGLRDVQNVIAAFQRFTFYREDLGESWVRPSLFLEMFGGDPDEWICVDNVDAVGRWNIQVYGYQPPKPPGKQNYSNVCRNAYHWRSDQFAAGETLLREGKLKRPPASTSLHGRTKGNARFDDRITIPFEGRGALLTCVVELEYAYGKAKRELDAESTLTTFFLPPAPPGTVSVAELAPTAFYPAATLLRDLPGVRPALDGGGGRSRPAVGFTSYANTVMNGCSYKLISKTGRDACQAACAADPDCQGYSHNKITQTCELKNTLTALRLDPLWVSGSPSSGPAPRRSIRSYAMVAYPVATETDARIEGKLIDEAKIDTEKNPEACSDRCKSNPMCLAAELKTSDAGGVCRLFSEVTGLRQIQQSEPFSTVWTEIKKQQ
jgi:hypothetical protein